MYERIHKNEINALPLVAFEGEIIVIDNEKQIKEAVDEILSMDLLLGFDTESKPVFQKGVQQRLALIQFATANKAWLFRVFKTGITSHLANLLSNNEITKLGMATADDVKKINKDFKIQSLNVIDISTLSKECGYVENGLRNLAARVLGIRISKAQQTSNWENEELNEAQQIYAATDAWLGREIYLELINQKMHGIQEF